MVDKISKRNSSNKRNNRKLLLIGILIIVLFFIGFFYWQNKKQQEQNKIVTIGYLPIYVDLPLFVAKEKGFFQARGVNVELKRFESSPEMATPLIKNEIAAAASIATTVALSTESRDPNKLKIFIVDNADSANYLSSFVALKSSSIKSIQDLKGKKIGGFPGPTATKFGKMVLEKYGLNPDKDVTWTEMPVNTHLTSLETKTVDALFTYEPTATQAVIEKNAFKILSGAVEKSIINPWQAGSWVMNNQFIEENPELSTKIILAIYDAIDYMRKNPAEAKSALLPYTKIKLEIAKETPNIQFTKIKEVDVNTFQKYADLHTEKGLISKKIDVLQMLLPNNLIK